ncbi:uncharacterized protein KIAA0825 homolog isoform X3 [Brienomyrus brachyistius]|uniref:uncharacterized protein KIAA0825 homolog isoform X3 n=1 Tax=Brienomyrus brachyistius TaxID=42636 RepID=UPI0020B31642|nr:uncharacterized protein KIAA0825 homolog isoform X3 [Brienomyrus brachyistius]
MCIFHLMDMEWQWEFCQDHAFMDCVSSVVPRELDVQQLLHDTEEKLKLNACCIEQSLRELQGKLDDTRAGHRTADCLQWFGPRCLSQTKPVSTGHQDLLDFLRALQQYLKTEEDGAEDTALHILLSISSRCGVAFPSFQQPIAPCLPVHAVRDEAALDVQEAWEDIRVQLRRHLLDKLHSADDVVDGDRGAEGCIRIAQRVRCFEQLLFLYPETEVLSRYQNLQVKFVQDLLHGTQPCSFERLADSLRTAAPTLSSMIAMDLQTLRCVVEPNTLVAFINQGYLNTISQELLVLIEECCENAGKDNTAHTSKPGKRSSTKAKAQAPREASQKGVRGCLTSQQLGCLAKISSTLLELDEQMELLVTKMPFLNLPGAPCSVRGILKKTREVSEMPAGNGRRYTDMFLQQNPEPVVLEFDWRSAFRELLSPVAHCLKAVLEDACSRSLLQEETAHSADTAISVILLPQRDWALPGSLESEAPKVIAKFCGDILKEFDLLLPLVLLCRDDPLLEVRSTFVEVCSYVASAILGRLEERAREVPSTAPLRNLPALLASSLHVQQWLGHIQHQLRDGGRIPLSLLPIQRCQELTEALQHQLTQYCIQTCATCILQDAEAHHWGDTKPFYEGERCSFSIQMWHYFLTGLRRDLWAMLPPCVAQKVLAEILSGTLEVLVCRYSQACPTYKRSQQIRADITAVILVAEQLVWSVSSSLEELLQPSKTVCPWISSIHSLCNQLLAVLVLVTAPLSELHRFCLGGSGGISSATTAADSGARSVHWLTVIRPARLPPEPLRTSTSNEFTTQLLLKLMSSQPDCDYKLLLQCLLDADCILLRVLLDNSYFCIDDNRNDPDSHKHSDAFMEAVFSVLVALNNIPGALTLVLKNYFDKRRLWDFLYNMTADEGPTKPAVLRCVRAALSKAVVSIVSHLIAMVLDHQAWEDLATFLPSQGLPESVLAKVPKEWHYVAPDARGMEASRGDNKLMIQAVSFVFAILPSAIASLPLPLRFLFLTGEKQVSQHAQQPKLTGLLVWGFVSCLCQDLEEGGRLTLDHRAMDKLALLSECLQSAMGNQRGGASPVVQKVLQKLEESRPDWTVMQMQKAHRLCAGGVLESVRAGVAQGSGGVPELTEQKISLMLLEVCHQPGGSEYLRQIYHIIRLNEDLLKVQLAAPRGQSDAPQWMVDFNLVNEHASPSPPHFNPLTCFQHIGSKEFSQSAISEWNWDWAQLLPAYLGMSPLTLSALLANSFPQLVVSRAMWRDIIVPRVQCVLPRISSSDHDKGRHTIASSPCPRSSCLLKRHVLLEN